MASTPQDPATEQWHVMAAYKFELKAEASLREAGFEVFLPKETIYVKKPRRRPVAVERPAISTLIFVHATRQRILDYKHTVDDRLKFRLDLSTPTPDGRPRPLTVPAPQMAAFISIWASRSTLHASLTPLPHSLPKGGAVEISDGPLKGLSATLVTRITPRSRNARLSIPLGGLFSVTIVIPITSIRIHSASDNVHI